MEEKRVKLGVDVGELSNQLVSINNLIEQNYIKATQGQISYNIILEKSIELLTQQVDLVAKSGPNQIVSIPKSNKIFGGGKEDASETNDFLEEILSSVNKIWEKFSSFSTRENGGDGGGGNVGGTTTTINENYPNTNGGKEKNIARTASGLAASGASDPNYIAAGLIGMVPLVGVGLASIVSKMISEAEQRVKAEAIFMGATGGDMPFVDLKHLGYKEAVAREKEAQYYTSNIHLSKKDFEFEKAYGVSGGTMDALLRSMRKDIYRDATTIRGDAKNFSSSEFGAIYLDFLEKEGKIDAKEVRGYKEDYLKILVDLNQQQLEMTGETNSIINSQVISNIAQLSEKFGDPTVLNKVIQGIKGGLMQPSTPQAEAIQYWAMSKVNPDATVWDMELMKADPFNPKYRGVLSEQLDMLRMGDPLQDRMNVSTAFNLPPAITEEFLTGLEEAEAKAKKENKIFKTIDYLEKGLGELDVDLGSNKISEELSKGAVSQNEVLLAKAADNLADMGEPLLKVTNEIVVGVGDISDKITKFFDTGAKKGFTEAILEAWSTIKEKQVDKVVEDVSSKFKAPTDTVVNGQKVLDVSDSWMYQPKKNNISPNSAK